MLVFAHLGLGSRLVRTFARGLPVRALLAGTILPDLVDKPLYFSVFLATGQWGEKVGIVSGTRTFGHTLIFLAALFAAAGAWRSRRPTFLALALGAATHLLLDNFLEPFAPLTEHSGRIALLFPLYGVRFPLAIHRTPGEHLFSHFGIFELGCEAVGAWLLWRLWRERKAVT